MKSPAIEADGLRKAFGQVAALDGLGRKQAKVRADELLASFGLSTAFAILSARIYARMSR